MLRVWLPLTKDLRQQGLSNVTVTNNGATYSSTGGKLGGCYIFDGVDDAITVGNLSTLVTDNFSFACWFYHDDTWSSKNYETIFGGPSGFELEAKSGSTNSPVIRAYSWGQGTFTYELNKWNHLVMTRTTSETKFYLNGELKLTGTAGTIPSGNYFVGSWSSTTGQNFKGKVNDVRIYDHCLSSMEVKELAKGLVLHYPLNRQGWGQENLITRYDTSFLSYPNGAVTLFSNQMNGGAQEIVSNIGGAMKCLHLHSNGGNGRQYGTLSATSGKSYTISCDYYSTSSQTYPFRGELNGGDYSWKGSNAVSYTMPNKWVRLSFGYLNLTSDATIYYFMQCSQNTDCYIKNLKIEEGSIATPWCPNSSDTLATTMGINSTTEYDCSGFGNNGTRTGTFTWTSDAPKYQVSSIHTGSNYIYLTPPSTEIQTIVVWVKWNTIPSGQSVILVDNGSGIGLGLMSTGILCSTSKAGNSYTFSKANLVANTWYHFVVVKTGTTTRKLYINGVEQTATSNTSNWTYSVNQLQLGKRSTTSDGFAGKLSDFRAYATALSADDVKSLYQNSAYIDSSGNVYGAVHEEV